MNGPADDYADLIGGIRAASRPQMPAIDLRGYEPYGPDQLVFGPEGSGQHIAICSALVPCSACLTGGLD